MHNSTTLEKAVEYQMLIRSIHASIYPHKVTPLRGDEFYASLSDADKLALLEAYVDNTLYDLPSLFEEIEEYNGYQDLQAQRNQREVEADKAYLNRQINL